MPSDPQVREETPSGPSSRAPESFGARMRHERERRKISIASIAENTKILGALLEGLEHDDVSRWPTGFYRRAFIRAYALAIGLDPDPVVQEFSRRFPDPDETVSIPAAAATPPPGPVLKPPSQRKVLVTVATDGAAFSHGRVLLELRERCCAIALDAFALGVVGLAIFFVFGSFWAPLAVAVASYYGLSIAVLGNTPGVCLFASAAAPRTR